MDEKTMLDKTAVAVGKGLAAASNMADAVKTTIGGAVTTVTDALKKAPAKKAVKKAMTKKAAKKTPAKKVARKAAVKKLSKKSLKKPAKKAAR